MRKLMQYLSGMIIMTLLAGCSGLIGPTAAPTKPLEPTPLVAATAPVGGLPRLTGDWRIALIKSGGIMGMSKSLEIMSNGNMTLTDMRTKKSSQASLPADRLKILTGLVADTSYQPAMPPSGCADCFIYNLEVTNGTQKFQVELNEIDLKVSGLSALVGFLGETMSSMEK